MTDQGPDRRKNALIVNALFVQNVRGKSIPIIKIIMQDCAERQESSFRDGVRAQSE